MKKYLEEYQKWCKSSDFDEETKKELLEIKDDEKEMERIVEFINNYPENPDASIIFDGSIDKATERFNGGK